MISQLQAALARLQRRAERAEEEQQELRRRNDELRHGQQELREFLESCAVGLQWSSQDGRVEWANQALLGLLGYTRDEYIGHSSSDFYADRADFEDVAMRLTRGETIRDREVRLRRKDGSIVHVALDSNALFEGGVFVRSRCFVRDISDRKRIEAERDLLLAQEQAARAEAERQRAMIEEALGSRDESLALLEAVLRAVPVGLAFVDRDLRYVLINPALAAVNAIPIESTIGRTLDEIIPQLAPEVEPLVLHVFEAGEPIVGWEAVAETPAAPGEPRTWRTDFFPVKGREGRVQWVGCLVADITVQREVQLERERLLTRAQEARLEAEAASRLKDEFLATMSHELRTPLTAVLGWVHLVSTRRTEPAIVDRGLEAIERSARAQAKLVDDILDVSRIVTGKLELHMRPVDVCATVKAAVDVVRPTADAKAVALDVMLDPEAGTLSADPDRLQQVVWNLLSNAVKFTPPCGRVAVRVKRERGSVLLGERVVIQVSDTGKGIPPGFLPHLWERFRQADSSTTRSCGGLGLGLAIVRHLVDAHGGLVMAESEGEGRGATFTVELPPGGAEAQRERPARPDRGLEGATLPRLDGLRVLVVDDEEDACDVVMLLLEDRGAKVMAARSAADALRAMGAFHPDVLISDIAMPDIDGYGLLSRIRALPAEEGGRIPAVALTAYTRVEDRVKAMLSGFKVHLPKPIAAEELVIAVASAAGRLPLG